MKLIFTNQSLNNLEDGLNFLLEKQKIPIEKVAQIKTQLLDKVDRLTSTPYVGQVEEYLEHLGKDHRRLVEGHFKIIYRIQAPNIYIIDFFNTRQNPSKMKS